MDAFWCRTQQCESDGQSELFVSGRTFRRYVIAQLVIVAVLATGFMQPLAAGDRRADGEAWRRLKEAGTTAFRRGDFKQAEADLKRACDIADSFQQPDARLILSLNNLAVVFAQQAKYDEAETLLKRVVQVTQQLRGPNHPETAVYLFNLALLYQNQGKSKQAEADCLRAVAIVKMARGPAHLDFAVSLNNLANLYRQQQEFDKAASLYKRSLAIIEDALGPNHRKVGVSLNNLAGLFRTQDKDDEAVATLTRALAVFEKSSGPQHPDVALALNNLAAIYSFQKEYAKAEPLLKRSVFILEQTLGARHPEVASGLVNLAVLHEKQGELKNAALLFSRAYAIVSLTFGSQHPFAVQCRSHLNRLSKLRTGPLVIDEFSIPKDGRPILVPVRIGKTVHSFLLDTGAEITVFDQSFQHDLKPMPGNIELATATKSLSLPRFQTPKAYVGHLLLTNPGYVICRDLSEIRRISGYNIQGVLGMDFLQHYVVRLDFDGGKLAFLTSPGSEAGSTVPVTFAQRRLPAIAATLGDGTLERLVIDTGADGTGTIERALFDKLRNRQELNVCGKTMQATVSGTTQRRVGQVNSVKLGSHHHESLIFDEGQHSVIGVGYLSRYVVTFDFMNRRMYMKKGARYDLRDSHDLSGLHLLRVDGKTMVHSVDRQSPAAQAGMSSGDILQELDGQMAQELDMYTIRRMLSVGGRQLHLKTQRGSESHSSRLKLKDSARVAERGPSETNISPR